MPSGLTSRASPSSRRASSSRNGELCVRRGNVPFLEAEDEHDLEVARARAQEIEHRNAAGLSAVGAAHSRTFERADDVFRAQRAAEREPAFELVRKSRHRLVRAQVEARGVVRRRLVEAVGVAEHPRRRSAQAVEQRRRLAQLLDDRERVAVQRERLGLDAVVRVDRAAAKTALEEVRLRPRHSGVRRAQEAVELAPAAAEPDEAEQADERAPERRLRKSRPRCDRNGDAKRAEPGLERRAPAVQRGTDDRDLLRRSAGPHEREDLAADQLERRPGAGALEEADGAARLRLLRRLVTEQVPLDVRESRMSEVVEPRRQDFDPPVRERAQVVDGRPKRLERRAPGLERHRDGHVRPPGERAQELPLGAGQILEAVCEDGLAAPRLEFGLKAVDCVPAQSVAVPAAEPVELGPVSREEPGEVALDRRRLEQARLELRERGRERVGEPGEPRRAPEAVQRRAADDAADEQRALGVAEQRPGLGASVGDPLEHVVERADRAAEERAAPRQEVTLDPLDVRPVRDDENRLAREHGQIALEQERHLARVGGPGDEAETHRSILDLGPDDS